MTNQSSRAILCQDSSRHTKAFASKKSRRIVFPTVNLSCNRVNAKTTLFFQVTAQNYGTKIYAWPGFWNNYILFRTFYQFSQALNRLLPSMRQLFLMWYIEEKAEWPNESTPFTICSDSRRHRAFNLSKERLFIIRYFHAPPHGITKILVTPYRVSQVSSTFLSHTSE